MLHLNEFDTLAKDAAIYPKFSPEISQYAPEQTLRTIITVNNLSTTVPTGGVENDYNLVWFLNGVEYFGNAHSLKVSAFVSNIPILSP